MDEMTTAQASSVLNVSERQVVHLVLQGTLTARRVGARMYLVDRASVERYARERRPAGRPRTRIDAAQS